MKKGIKRTPMTLSKLARGAGKRLKASVRKASKGISKSPSRKNRKLTMIGAMRQIFNNKR